MLSVSPATLCLVEVGRSPTPGFSVHAYKNHLDMVLQLVNTGCIGDRCWGDDAHLAALEQIETKIAEVREKIKESAEREDNREGEDGQ
jgi:hypothetical protein